MVQDYISVDWDVSPRIVTVADSETAVSVQDLYDTLRSLESAPGGVDNDAIVAGAGKEALGPGLQVGLTITLLNAKLAFEARTAPPCIQCTVSGGNLVALDGNGDIMESIKPTDYTQIIRTASSSATLVDPQVWQAPVESTYTAAELLRLLAAVMIGKSSGSPGSTITFRNVDDNKNRVVATVDTDGNRLALTLDASD